MTAEQAYCLWAGVDAAALLEAAGYTSHYCWCASDTRRPANYCCSKCGGAGSYYERPNAGDLLPVTADLIPLTPALEKLKAELAAPVMKTDALWDNREEEAARRAEEYWNLYEEYNQAL